MKDRLGTIVLSVAYTLLAGVNTLELAHADPQIVPDGQTLTSLEILGATTNVRTGTIDGKNAINSFSTFGVFSGNTVNLYLPEHTDNLVNLVFDARSNIDGALNSIKNGTIGGNVFFANPYGTVVGAEGAQNWLPGAVSARRMWNWSSARHDCTT